MRWRFGALFLILAPAVLIGQAQAGRGLRPTAAVIGQVVDSTTGRGVRQASVRLRSGTLTQTRIADDRGRFYFYGLPAGPVVIDVTKTGFIDGSYGKRRAGGRGTPLELGAGEIVPDTEIQIFRPATISGVVVDEGNEPAIGARVIAYRRQFIGSGWRFVPAGARTTDDEGRYRIFGLVPGEYVVSVPGGVVTLPMGVLEEVGQTGRSTSELGVLLTMNGFASSGAALASMIQVDADDRSVFLRAPSPTPAAASERHEFTYPTQYFPFADVPGRATTIAILPGEDFVGVNFQLQPVPAARIDGSAIDPGGRPAANQMLRLLIADSEDQGFGTESAATITGRDGTFTFLRVPAGRYRIEARSAVSLLVSPNAGRPTTLAGFPLMGQGPSGTQPAMVTRDFDDLPLATATYPLSDGALWGRKDVTVHDRNVDGVTIALAPAISVTGRVTFESAGRRPSPEQIARIQISLEPADSSAMALAPVRADNSGSFTFRGVVPGGYYARVSGVPDGWFLRAAISRGRDVSDAPLDAHAGSGADLTMAFSTRGTNISGTVRNARGLPVRAATVLAFPATAGSSVPGSFHRMREVRASTTGVFSIDGLPPGEYFVIAIEDAAAEGWQDARSLQDLRRGAARIALKAGERRSLEVRIR